MLQVHARKVFQGWSDFYPSRVITIMARVGAETGLGELSRWVVGSGQRWFWLDNWIREILHGPRPVDGNLTIAQGLNIIYDLWCNIPPRLQERIRSTVLMPTELNKLVFVPKPHGTFSLKEYLEHTRIRGIEQRWATWVWNPCFSPNVSVFLWKLLCHALPVDSRI